MKSKNFYQILMVAALVIIIGVSSIHAQETTSSLSWPQLDLRPDDRILILAPHPDDEILGCAGIIQKAKAMGLALRIVFLTYGDNNEWSFLTYRNRPVIVPQAVRNMGLLRHDEALVAGNFLGILPKQIIFLGYPDFGTLNIWYEHWDQVPSFLSMLTKVRSVPYLNAFRPGAAYKGEEILKDLTANIEEFKPTKIFLSHPGDHNGDHRALYLFTRIALWNLKLKKQPELYPYLVHYKQWPLPRGYRPEQQITPPGVFKQEIPWRSESLSDEEVGSKWQALKRHWSQYKSARGYLNSFVRRNELFGDFPLIRLRVNAPSISLAEDKKEDFSVFPEESTDEERASFVGLEERYVHLEDNDLILSIKLSRPLAKEIGVCVFLFGYRSDIPFSRMPKLRLRFGAIKHIIFDKNINISDAGIKIIRCAKKIIIRLPLKVLGNPEKILTSANTYLGNIPLDWVSWRILELPQSYKEASFLIERRQQ